MNIFFLAISYVIFSFSIYALMHLVFFRIFRPKERWVVLKSMYFIMMPVTMIGAWLLTKTHFYGDAFPVTVASEVIAVICLLWLLHNAYLMFYAFVDRSLSIRVNVEIYDAGNAGLTYDELMARYNPEQSYLRRLEILRHAGFLSLVGDRYFITPKGARLAKAVRFLKNLYKLGLGG